MKNLKFLHIYGQSFWHEPAFIVGDISGLKALQKAIEDAINNKKGSTELFTGDREGYKLFVICDEGDFGKRALPYTDEVASEKDPNAIWPWQDIK